MSPALALSPIPERITGNAALDAAHLEMREMDGALRAAKAQRVADGALRAVAEMYVDAAHAYQRLRWGRVRDQLTVAGVLR